MRAFLNSESQIAAYQALVNERARMREPIVKSINALVDMRRALYFLFVVFNGVLIYQLVSFSAAHASIPAPEGAASVIQSGVGSLIPEFLTGALNILVSYFQAKPFWGIGLVATPILMLFLHRSLKDRMIKVLTGYWWSGTNRPVIAVGANQPKVYRTGGKSSSVAEGKLPVDNSVDQPADRADS
jgi:hypothetical protein